MKAVGISARLRSAVGDPRDLQVEVTDDGRGIWVWEYMPDGSTWLWAYTFGALPGTTRAPRVVVEPSA